MSTVHNSAPKGSISKLVLVTGDPLRCKRFAELYLTSPKLLSEVRNVYCYTGMYKGVEITLMAHGMGVGSMGIYSYELFSPEIYDADIVIRLGSCGGMSEDVNVNDLVLVTSIHSNSNYGELLHLNPSEDIKPDHELINLAKKTAESLGIPLKSVRNFTSDNFYSKYSLSELHRKTGCDTVEMEAYALGLNAIYHNKKFLTILTVSDVDSNRTSGVIELTRKEREEGLGKMFQVGLETLVSYSKTISS
ncbi:purine-nucleoside phosphorylase [Candidatus Mycoplasma haematominutum]|uniref:Uridine phosphorylase n=1 Tax=Candidatus Mycoplasma haematominutum 'Birmingham 1' TaxID=1116213 RepID=G8C2L0_9MOLU|nr:purine-nucleoside phosphorylase [Candidatus Mycoplasma haematominutum]CCE66558.1 purine nucleoside phosphorylase [Candidatus Mycoplasma haematominutum 'Birmingham 1']